VLDRLGRAHLAIDDHARAVEWFDAMKVAFPRKTRTVDAQFMAAWSRYNRGEYADAAQAFLAHAAEYKRWRRRAESLWFAGWSAYRANDDALARRAFDQVLVDHPTSEMALWAHYWGGRIRERSQDTEGARAAYRNVLRIAPLSYQASWAAVRLERLGERVVMSAPRAPERPAGLVDVLTLLGATRPVGVDRGIALHRAGLEDEAVEELDEANGELAKVKDMRGRVMIAEMLESLGAHHQAYRFATRLTQSGADLVTGEPYAWRAWRLAYPKAFEAEVKAAAEAHDIDPLLLLSIMRSESSFRPTARSPVGARGLMQLMPATAKRIGKVATGGRPHAGRYGEPASNVWLGAWYLKQLLGRYDGQVALAAGAYNAGPGAMDRWLESGRQLELDTFVETISYRETRLYVRKVLETYQIYRRLDAAPELDLHWVVSADVPKRDSSVAF
jgi:soluble lytic murein transglycosylase